MGFEPTRAEHNGLAVHRLNHSATSSSEYHYTFTLCAVLKEDKQIKKLYFYQNISHTFYVQKRRRGWDSNPRVQSTTD